MSLGNKGKKTKNLLPRACPVLYRVGCLELQLFPYAELGVLINIASHDASYSAHFATTLILIAFGVVVLALILDG